MNTTVKLNQVPYETIKQVPISEVRTQTVNYLEKDDKATVGDIIKSKEQNMGLLGKNKKEKEVEHIKTIDVGLKPAETEEIQIEKSEISNEEVAAAKAEISKKMDGVNKEDIELVTKYINESRLLAEAHEKELKAAKGNLFKDGFLIVSGMGAATILTVGAIKGAELLIRSIMSKGSGTSD